MGLNLEGEPEINTCGFWSPIYPSRKQIFEEVKVQCELPVVNLIMSITVMTKEDFDRFLEV
jgi:hypothetical protein